MINFMSKFYYLLLLVLLFGCKPEETTKPVNNDPILPNVISIGESNKVEIVTWNIEHFPKTDFSDDYVKAIMEELDADIYVLQEIQSKSIFASMLGEMDDYNYFLLSSTTGLNFAIVYKMNFVKVKNIRNLFAIEKQYFAGRPPLLAKLEWQNNGITKELTIIDLHLKCCGDNKIDVGNNDDEEYRRFVACQLLHNYAIDVLKDDNVIILGDWNDAIQDPNSTNVFKIFIDDSLNFKFADMAIANGDKTNWSWQGWSSSWPAIHFDHILINNNLFDEFENSSIVEVIKLDEFFENGNSEYDNNVSDHRPVYFKFNP